MFAILKGYDSSHHYGHEPLIPYHHQSMHQYEEQQQPYFYNRHDQMYYPDQHFLPGNNGCLAKLMYLNKWMDW